MSIQKNQFDPSRFAVAPSHDPGEVGVKKVITRIDVRKPNKQEFFRIHPSLQLEGCVIEVPSGMSREFYLLDPTVAHAIPGDYKVRNLTLCTNRQEGLFLWPIPVLSTETMTTKWSETAVEAANLARESWLRMVANMSTSTYELYKAENLAVEPSWPEIDMARVLELAFGPDKIINSESHPVIRQLQGLE